MGSIALPALSVKPPEQIDPLGQANKLLSYRALMQEQQTQQQQQQLNSQKIQEGQSALNDQRATTQAMHDWDGKDLDELTNLVIKNGGSSNAVIGLKKQILDQKKGVSDLAKTDTDTLKARLDNEATKNDYLAQQIDGLKTLTTDPKNPLSPQAAAAQFESIKQKAVANGHLDPQAAQGIQLDPSRPIADQLQGFEDNLLGHKKVVDALKAHADIAKGEAETAHNKEMETPAAEKEFQAYYDSYLTAGNLPKNAKNELAARKEYKELGKPAAAQINLTGDAIDLAANQYVSTGVMPALGMGNSGMRQQILNRAAEIQKRAGANAAATGGAAPNDIATNQAEFATAKSPANVAFFGSANSLLDKSGTLEQLEKSAKSIPQGKLPVLNSIADWTKLQTGGGPLAGFAATALGVADDYSKVMGGGQGSDTSRKQALDLIAAAQSPDQRAQAIKSIRDAVRSQKDARIGANGQMKKIYAGNEDPKYQQANAPATPNGATHTGVGSIDKKKHWLDVNGKDLGLAE